MHDPDPTLDRNPWQRMPAGDYRAALRPLTWRASRQPWELERAAAALDECRRVLAGGCPGRLVGPAAATRAELPALERRD